MLIEIFNSLHLNHIFYMIYIIYMNIDTLLQARPFPDSYTPQVLQNIQLLSFKKDNAVPFGSFIFKIQKFPGDIDLIETFEDCISIDDVIHKFKKKLIQVIKHIIDLKLHYMVEFKMGLDHRFIFDIGYLKDGIYHQNIDNIIENVSSLYDHDLLNDYDLSFIDQYLYKNDTSSYDMLFNFFRDKYIIRWSDQDILNGYKILIGNKKITIDEALRHKTYVKIDMITLINNRFVEITNFFILVYNDKSNNTQYAINFGEYIDPKFLREHIEETLPFEIEKLFYSDYYFSPFKGSKRMWSLSRHFHYNNIIQKLSGFISGNISFLYMLKSEVDTLINLLSKLKNPPMIHIFNQIQEIKSRLTYILEISDKEHQFDDMFNSINQYSSKDIIIHTLKHIKELFSHYINHFSLKYLKSVNLFPVPRYLLPKQLSYIK